MYQTNSTKRSLRSALLLGAASAAAISLSLPATAQESTETVVVTGSRIPQQGLYSASPVTAVGQQEIRNEGTTNVETLLNNLPSVFADQNSGVSNGSSGTANVDLRGLGSSRTLVLVNGSRLMPADVADPVADLNVIPASLVDHVEVLTGGASAVYGSDALAGVVNFIMRKDFEGVELDGQYSVTNNANDTNWLRGLTQARINQGAYGFAQSQGNIWNGATDDATLLMGVNAPNGKGNITAYFSYRNTQPVLEATRDYSECTIAGKASKPSIHKPGQGFSCAGSSNFNRWLSYDNGYKGSFSSIPYDYFETGTGAPGSGVFGAYTGAGDQRFNYGAFNYLQRSDTRYTGGFFAHYEINKQLDVYSSFMFADDHTDAQIAPSGLFLGGGNGYSGAVYVNCNNPLMTAQENQQLCGLLPGDAFVAGKWNGAGNAAALTGFPGGIAGQAGVLIGRRDIEGANRVDHLRHTAYRMQVGAKGDLGDGWNYDIYAQYGLTLYSESYTGEFSKNRVQNALEVDPATGHCYATEPGVGGSAPTDPNCVPLDIFNGLGSIGTTAHNYINATGLKEGWTEESIISGALTGDLGEWGIQSPWAKSPVAVSIGTEYRQEKLSLTTDQEFSTNDLYGQGSATLSVPTSGFNVVEGFTELRIPVVQGMPFFEDLTVNAGYRYSSYNVSGRTTAYKYGAEWQPIDDVRVRASYDRAVRAPNVIELFSPQNVVLFSGQDPCANATGPVLANCIGQGVPNAGTGVLSCPATQCNVAVSGNKTLKPETSDTRSIGLVLTPTFIDGFTATIDYFDIKVNNYINALGPNFVLAECYGTGATVSSQAFFCPMVHRNGAGLIFSSGGYVNTPNINTGYLKTTGVDYELNYRTDSGDWGFPGWGSASFNVVGTWLDQLATEQVPINGLTTAAGLIHPYNCAGLFGLSCGTPNPKWRNKVRVTWTTPWDVDLSFQWRYIGAVSLDADTTNQYIGGGARTYTACPNGKLLRGVGDCTDQAIASYSYFDLAADWNVRTGVDLHAGVNNLLDKAPPVLGQNALPSTLGNGNTFPGVYDALGREVFVGATIKY